MPHLLLTRRRLLVAAGACALLGAAVLWFQQPERRLQRAWHRLLATVEARNVTGLRRILADDYRDRWGYDRRGLSEDARLAFFQFRHLEIRTEQVQVRRAGDSAIITAMIRIEADGGGQVPAARAAVNALFTPFTFEWRREPGLVGAWRLVRFDHPELDLTRFRSRWM